MATITFRVTEEEKDFLKKVAKFNNKTISEFVKEKVLASAENQIDFYTYKKLMAQHNEKDGNTSHTAMLEH
ncbi:DUF1778 domain-containing protein [Enterococcus sp. BWT-B8]|uniref:type II toxin-antitoxin system RelB family antitoxin n=1 Tax=Enterococcus sp. BWT-B8 TaxID=2885157 RepID=UPI002A0AFB05|nr:DUF6290 family protein [Enterococcus sp. BWT-B8]MCB5951869.1 DUF1778 domain-containing protein [Enterococcus sp. BWT-B8]